MDNELINRYNTHWYEKRMKQNRNIKNFLIDKIEQHKEIGFSWVRDDLLHLNYEDLLEIAVASVNKTVSITLGSGSDISNNKDCKMSIVRSNSYGKNYSALITGCSNKEYILSCVYEPCNENFYFFAFPATLKEHTIPFEVSTGAPRRWSERGGYNTMWTKWECNSFEEMALTA